MPCSPTALAAKAGFYIILDSAVKAVAKKAGKLMIGRIRGKILEKSPPLIVIDIHGLGYEVFAPMTTF